MIKKILVASLLLLTVKVNAQTPAYVPAAENIAARQNFEDMKFGLFIHWGIYSELGAGEWVMNEKTHPLR
jgi:alpha-L-fucosidase